MRSTEIVDEGDVVDGLVRDFPLKLPLSLKGKALTERCLRLHEGLVQSWGGWRMSVPAVGVRDGTLSEKEFQVVWAWLMTEGQVLGWNFTNFKGVIGRKGGGPELVLVPWSVFKSRKMAGELKEVLGGEVAGIKDEVEVVLGRVMKDGVLTAVSCKIRPGQAVSGPILQAVEKVGASEVQMKMWTGFFQKLGEQVWGEKERFYGVTLSVAPSDFIRLGHYGEGGSCFANGGAQESSKFFLAGDVPDSFVVLYHKAKAEGQIVPWEAGKPVAARAWGVGLRGIGALVSNFYLLTHATLKGVTKVALQKGLDLKGRRLVCAPSAGLKNSGGLYMNGDSEVYYSAPEASKKGPPVLSLSKIVQERYFEELSRYLSVLGIFSRTGRGPQLLVSGGGFTMPTAKAPARWPYPGLDLREMTEKDLKDNWSQRLATTNARGG